MILWILLKLIFTVFEKILTLGLSKSTTKGYLKMKLIYIYWLVSKVVHILLLNYT
jgi:hypothetical protein